MDTIDWRDFVWATRGLHLMNFSNNDKKPWDDLSSIPHDQPIQSHGSRLNVIYRLHRYNIGIPNINIRRLWVHMHVKVYLENVTPVLN